MKWAAFLLLAVTSVLVQGKTFSAPFSSPLLPSPASRETVLLRNQRNANPADCSAGLEWVQHHFGSSCQPCPSGTWQGKYRSQLQCKPKTVCSSGSYFIDNPLVESSCEVCPAHSEQPAQNHMKTSCNRREACPEGEAMMWPDAVLLSETRTCNGCRKSFSNGLHYLCEKQDWYLENLNEKAQCNRVGCPFQPMLVPPLLCEFFCELDGYCKYFTTGPGGKCDLHYVEYCQQAESFMEDGTALYRTAAGPGCTPCSARTYKEGTSTDAVCADQPACGRNTLFVDTQTSLRSCLPCPLGTNQAASSHFETECNVDTTTATSTTTRTVTTKTITTRTVTTTTSTTTIPPPLCACTSGVLAGGCINAVGRCLGFWGDSCPFSYVPCTSTTTTTTTTTTSTATQTTSTSTTSSTTVTSSTTTTSTTTTASSTTSTTTTASSTTSTLTSSTTSLSTTTTSETSTSASSTTTTVSTTSVTGTSTTASTTTVTVTSSTVSTTSVTSTSTTKSSTTFTETSTTDTATSTTASTTTGTTTSTTRSTTTGTETSTSASSTTITRTSTTGTVTSTTFSSTTGTDTVSTTTVTKTSTSLSTTTVSTTSSTDTSTTVSSTTATDTSTTGTHTSTTASTTTGTGTTVTETSTSSTSTRSSTTATRTSTTVSQTTTSVTSTISSTTLSSTTVSSTTASSTTSTITHSTTTSASSTTGTATSTTVSTTTTTTTSSVSSSTITTTTVTVTTTTATSTSTSSITVSSTTGTSTTSTATATSTKPVRCTKPDVDVICYEDNKHMCTGSTFRNELCPLMCGACHIPATTLTATITTTTTTTATTTIRTTRTTQTISKTITSSSPPSSGATTTVATPASTSTTTLTTATTTHASTTTRTPTTTLNVTNNDGKGSPDDGEKHSTASSDPMWAVFVASAFVLLVGGFLAGRRRRNVQYLASERTTEQNTSGRRNTKFLEPGPLDMSSKSSFTFNGEARRKSSVVDAWSPSTSPTWSQFPRGSDQQWSPTFAEGGGSSVSAFDEYIGIVDQLAGESTYMETKRAVSSFAQQNNPDSTYVDMVPGQQQQQQQQQHPFYDEASPSGPPGPSSPPPGGHGEVAAYSLAQQNNPESSYVDMEPILRVPVGWSNSSESYIDMDHIHGMVVTGPGAVEGRARHMTNSSYSNLPPMEIDATPAAPKVEVNHALHVQGGSRRPTAVVSLRGHLHMPIADDDTIVEESNASNATWSITREERRLSQDSAMSSISF